MNSVCFSRCGTICVYVHLCLCLVTHMCLSVCVCVSLCFYMSLFVLVCVCLLRFSVPIVQLGTHYFKYIKSKNGGTTNRKRCYSYIISTFS